MMRPSGFQLTFGILCVLVSVDFATGYVPWWVFPAVLGAYGVGGHLYLVFVSRTSADDDP